MRRRQFFRAAGAAALAAGCGTRRARGVVPSHNWDKYDFGAAADAKDAFIKALFLNIRLKKWFPAAGWS